MRSSLTIPDNALAAAIITDEGETYGVIYGGLEGCMPLPRSDAARMLRMAADALEQTAADLGDH
jgi:hypothetical protein